MSAFQDRMKKLAGALSPEAKEMVKQVLYAEHQKRFADRKELPESFAFAALNLAKNKEDNE